MHLRNRVNKMIKSIMKRQVFSKFFLAKFKNVFLFWFFFEKMSTSYVACYVTYSCRKTFKQPLTDVFQEVFLKFLQYSQETPVLKTLFKKVAELKTCIFIKKAPRHMCFPMNIARFLKAAFLWNTCWSYFSDILCADGY